MSLFYRIGFLLAMLVSFLSGFGQSRAQSIYDKYGHEKGFISFSFTKSMIDGMNLNLDEEGKKITGDFHEFKILIYNNQKGEMSHFDTEVSSQMKSLHYRQVHPEGEKDENVEFWIEGNGNRVTECHIIIGNKGKAENSTIFVSFYGNFKVEDLEKLQKAGMKYGA